MFNHKHYVPILKSKRGELWALQRISPSSRRLVTPLIEILLTPTQLKTPKEALKNICESVRKAWGTSDRLFIDTRYLGVQSAKDAAKCRRWIQGMRDLHILAVPVTSLTRSEAFQTAIRESVKIDKRGVMMRLGIADFTNSEILIRALDRLLSFLEISRNDVDLLLDYEAQDDDATIVQLLRFHLDQLPAINQWRTVTMAAASSPVSLVGLSKHDWHKAPRREWSAWLLANTASPHLKRKPAFGDYLIRDPGIPPTFGTPFVNIRYTANGHWIIRRGDRVKEGGAKQIFGICASLVQRPEFRGGSFSAGDSEMAARAANQGSSGGAQQWVQWAHSHHIEFVVDQIANGSGV